MPVMPQQRCYYEVLSVERTATEVEIKKAYKKLAIENHPDRNSGDEEATQRFKEAAEAYDVLSDADKRSRYDRFGHDGVKGAGGRGPQFQDLGDIFDLFGGIFGGGGGSSRRSRGGPQRGEHLQTSLTVDLLDASKGVKKEIKLQRKKSCERCDGSGSEPGHKAELCDYCSGVGQVVQSQGFFRVQTTCPACRGAGKIVRHKCNECYGSGQEEETVTLEVNVPAGIDNGMQLCVRGEGEAGPNNGPRGDLYVDIRVKENKRFQREGKHLICEIPVTYTQAALGAVFDIPLLEGTHNLNIPAGTQPNEVIRLRGKGLADPRGGSPGDLHLAIKVIVPKKLDEQHEKLLRELAEIEQSRVKPHEKSWLEKVKEFFTGDEHDDHE